VSVFWSSFRSYAELANPVSGIQRYEQQVLTKDLLESFKAASDDNSFKDSRQQ
jgi:hypothetical protein